MSYTVHPRHLLMPPHFFSIEGIAKAPPIAMRSLFDAYVQAQHGQYVFHREIIPKKENLLYDGMNAKQLSSVVLSGFGSRRHAAEVARPFFDAFANVSVQMVDVPSEEHNDYALSAFFYLLCTLQLGMLRGMLSGACCSEQLGWLAQVPVQAETILDHVYDLAWFTKQEALRAKALCVGEGTGTVLAMEAKRIMQPIMPCKALPKEQAGLALRSNAYSLLIAFVLSEADAKWAIALLKQTKNAHIASAIITTHAYGHIVKPFADACFTIPAAPSIVIPILGILPMEVFANHTALSKGLDKQRLLH